MGLGDLKGHYIFAHEGSSYETYIRLFETAGSDPARCAFSVGLEFGDRPCAIAPMKPAYAKASAFADATAAALCAMAVKTADKSARRAGR